MSDDIIKLHDLRPAPGSNKKKTRVGRGEGSKGKTAGRGTKGTKARKTVPAGFEGGQMPIHMRLPKLKGFKKYNKVEYQVVNLDDLAEIWPKGATLTIADFVEAGLVRHRKPVKVLGDGDITAKYDITATKFSGSAKEKIEAAGGSCTEEYFSKRAAKADEAEADAEA
ncbi:MAG: 50S ribosomal protein L15 [Corynebacterium sp.]|nr:50S ribosomal protein L15 [Corynebacterium sp.]